MAFILCVPDSLLGHLWTDFDQTFGVYRVDSELVQRHIFDFRFRPQTGSELFFHKPEVRNFGTGSQKYSRSKENLVVTRIEISKNEDRTFITKTHELSDGILFDLRFRCFQLPVSEK